MPYLPSVGRGPGQLSPPASPCSADSLCSPPSEPEGGGTLLSPGRQPWGGERCNSGTALPKAGAKPQAQRQRRNLLISTPTLQGTTNTFPDWHLTRLTNHNFTIPTRPIISRRRRVPHPHRPFLAIGWDQMMPTSPPHPRQAAMPNPLPAEPGARSFPSFGKAGLPPAFKARVFLIPLCL